MDLEPKAFAHNRLEIHRHETELKPNVLMVMTPPHTKSDVNDVRCSLAGDRDAFGRLYDRHAPAVRAVVAAVSGDISMVEDLTQETFLRGYRRLESLKDAARFGRWIQGVARLVAKERIRELRRRTRPFRAAPDEGLMRDDVDEQVARGEEQVRVMSALASLPEKERLAIHAYYFLEQRGDEAAVAMGMSRSGFYVALERGIKRLRTVLIGHLVDRNE